MIDDEVKGQKMNEGRSTSEREYTLFWVVIVTMLYLVALPVFYFISLVSTLVIDHAKIPNFLWWLGAIPIFYVPLSIPISIFFMWYRYFQRQYSKANFHMGAPVWTAFIVWSIALFFSIFK